MKFQNKTKYVIPFWGSCVLAAFACSCDHNTEPVNDIYEIVAPAAPSETPVVTVDYAAAILGNVGALEGPLSECLTNIVEPAKARLLVVASDAIEKYNDILTQAYNNGVLIAVVDPDASSLEEWSDNNNIFYGGPTENETCALFGFCRQGSFYVLQRADDLTDDDVPMYHFGSWVNTTLATRASSDLRSTDIRKHFLPQKVTHTFALSLDEQELKDNKIAEPGTLKTTTTANATYTIYPMHVFDGAPTGDYYLVEAEVTLHNAPLNNGLWRRTTGDNSVSISGFYLNKFNTSSALVRKAGKNFEPFVSHSYADGTTPSPATTAGSDTYNKGFAWSMDATVSGGIYDDKGNYMLIATKHWTWDNNATDSCEEVTITRNEIANTPSYTLEVNDYLGVSTEELPEAATGDVTLKYSWIWRVPATATDNDRLYMEVNLDPVYRAIQESSAASVTSADFHAYGSSAAKSALVYRFPIVAPNREATGSMIIRYSSEESWFVNNIAFWRADDPSGNAYKMLPNTICTPNSTGGSGVSATKIMLPATSYVITGKRFKIENDDTTNVSVIRTIAPIELGMGEDITVDFGSELFTVE